MHLQSIDLSAAVESEVDHRVQQVTAEMEDLLQWVTDDRQQRLQLHRVESEVLVRLMRIGVMVLALAVAFRLPNIVPTTLRTGRGWYRCNGLVSAPIRTRFGEFWGKRPEYELVHGHGPKRLAPFDRQIGLAAGRMSLGVHLLVGRLVAWMPFARAREAIELFGGYAPATRSMHGITDGLGPQAAHYMENLPAPDDDGELLAIETDHKGAPHMSPTEHLRRRKKHVKRPRGMPRRAYKKWRRQQMRSPRKQVGDKSKNARMASIGAVYTLRLLPDGSVEGPINRRVFGTFKGPTELFRILKGEALKRGYDKKRSIFLADGESRLWKLWEKFFPEATPCLDWYHLSEYLWTAAGAVHPPKRKMSTPVKQPRSGKRKSNAQKPSKDDAKAMQRRWVESRQEELCRDDVDAVLKALQEARATFPSTGPGTRARRENVDRAITYIENHRNYMPYGQLKDLVMGTGNIEGAVRSIGARLDGPGMRWSTERSEHVLALVCVLVSHEWEGFAEAVMVNHESQTINDWRIERVTPTKPMTPHKARKKAA